MARMLARVRGPWCPVCKTRPGRDCPDHGRSKRAQRYHENHEWKGNPYESSPWY